MTKPQNNGNQKNNNAPPKVQQRAPAGYAKKASTGFNPRSIKQVSRKRDQGGISFDLSESAAGARYVACVLDPFNAPEGAKVCNDNFTQPTAAIRMSYGYKFTANANGHFAISYNCQNGWGTGMLNIFNDVSYDPDTGSQAATATQVLTKNSQMSSSNVLDYRVVGTSIQCKYVGKEVDRAGNFHCAFLPFYTGETANVVNCNTSDLKDQYYYREISNYEIPEVLWVPRDDVDQDFVFASPNKQISSCLIQGVGFSPSSQFAVSIVLHLEYHPSTTNKQAAVSTNSYDGGYAKQALHEFQSKNRSYVASPASDRNVAGAVSSLAERRGVKLSPISINSDGRQEQKFQEPHSATARFAKGVSDIASAALINSGNPYAAGAGLILGGVSDWAYSS